MATRFMLISFLVALSCNLSYQQIKFCPQPEGYDIANITVYFTKYSLLYNKYSFNYEYFLKTTYNLGIFS